MASNKGFFRREDSDDSDEGSDEKEEILPVGGGKKAGGRFQADSDSESDDDTQRVVRTEKEKKFDAILTITVAIRNQLRNNNWVEVQDGEWWWWWRAAGVIGGAYGRGPSLLPFSAPARRAHTP